MDNQWGIINEYTSVSHNMMEYSKYHIFCGRDPESEHRGS